MFAHTSTGSFLMQTVMVVQVDTAVHSTTIAIKIHPVLAEIVHVKVGEQYGSMTT